jgi:uncharacterized membrane protein
MTTDAAQPTPLTTAQRAANWMMGVASVYACFALIFGILAFVVFGSYVGDGSERADPVANVAEAVGTGIVLTFQLAFTGLMLFYLSVAIPFFVLQRSVRQGQRSAITKAKVVCWLAVVLPVTLMVLGWMANAPSVWEILGSVLALPIWVGPPLRAIRLLRSA